MKQTVPVQSVPQISKCISACISASQSYFSLYLGSISKVLFQSVCNASNVASIEMSHLDQNMSAALSAALSITHAAKARCPTCCFGTVAIRIQLARFDVLPLLYELGDVATVRPPCRHVCSVHKVCFVPRGRGVWRDFRFG